MVAFKTSLNVAVDGMGSAFRPLIEFSLRTLMHMRLAMYHFQSMRTFEIINIMMIVIKVF